MAIDPTALGFTERRPGSGIWHKPGTRDVHEVTTCETCQQDFMGRRYGRKGTQRFCTPGCKDQGAERNPPNYAARHTRLRRQRGSAKDQLCIDCGQPAAEWAQVHGTTGMEAGDYEPRCLKCHAEYDDETKARGERHGCAKLDEETVRLIRSAHGVTQRDLARTHGVSQSAIHLIRSGKRWKTAVQLQAAS